MIKIQRPTCPNPSSLSSGNYKHDDNKNALRSASYDKCMYCESKIAHVYYGDVEHIKPKSKFPKLEFDWNNLGYVCAKCNNAKSNKFDDSTPFINPYNENPEDFFIALGAMLKSKTGLERSDLTIIDIDLNRTSIVEKRQERIDLIEKSIKACFNTKNITLQKNALDELKKEAGIDKEYSFFIKSLFKLHGI